MSQPARIDHQSTVATADLELTDGARRRIADSVPANTSRAYQRVARHFTEWCSERHRAVLPCTPETLASYVDHLAEQGKSPASLEQSIAAIRTLHRVAGLEQPSTEAARAVLRTHKRERAAAGQRTRKSAPITITEVRAIVDTTADDTIGLRDRLLVSLGVSMFGRRSELSALELSDVQETADGLEVLVKMSKTDQSATGAEVAVYPGVHALTDPVRLVRDWRALLEQHGITDGPLLRTVDRHGRIGGAMSGHAINERVRLLATRAHLPNPERFTAHSLRAGGATVAFRNRAAFSEVTRQGRWADGSAQALEYWRATDKWTNHPLANSGL
jgi:site-specific recombinase XerD